MRYVCLLATLLAVASPAFAAQPHSGFIDNLPPMTADAGRPGAMMWKAPGKSLGSYHKVVLDPVLVELSPASPVKAMDPDLMAGIAGAFRDAVTAKLGSAYPMAEAAAPDVLRLRMAITNVKMTKKKKSVLNFTPAGLVVSAAKKMANPDSGIDLREATIEAELLDATTGTRLSVLIEPMSGGDAKKSTLKWDDVTAAADYYADRLRKRLDADHAGK